MTSEIGLYFLCETYFSELKQKDLHSILFKSRARVHIVSDMVCNLYEINVEKKCKSVPLMMYNVDILVQCIYVCWFSQQHTPSVSNYQCLHLSNDSVADPQTFTATVALGLEEMLIVKENGQKTLIRELKCPDGI